METTTTGTRVSLAGLSNLIYQTYNKHCLLDLCKLKITNFDEHYMELGDKCHVDMLYFRDITFTIGFENHLLCAQIFSHGYDKYGLECDMKYQWDIANPDFHPNQVVKWFLDKMEVVARKFYVYCNLGSDKRIYDHNQFQ